MRRTHPAALGWLAKHVIRHAAASGIDPGQLLDRAGLPPQPWDEDETRFPLRDQAILLNVLAEALGDELVGFHLALDFEFREWGSIYYSVASSSTLQEAIAREALAASPMDEGFTVLTRGELGLGFGFQFVGIERRLDQQLADFALTAHLRMFRHLTNLHLVPSYVGFVHRGHSDVSEMRRFFGTEIEFGASEDQALFHPEAASVPLPSSDPILAKLMMKLQDGSSAALEGEPFRIRVENALTVMLGRGPIHMINVARDLGLSRRTLARRLASEGETFSGILDRARQALAMHYLRQTRIPISQIGWSLGYADAGAFVRAVRRWTGVSPLAVRHGRDGGL